MVTVTAPLTPKSDKNPKVIKLKVFWKTTRMWTAADVINYRENVLAIAESIRKRKERFTCEDFSLKILIELSSSNGLPLKLTTGEGVFRNMDVYNANGNGKYDASPTGFANMVMLSYGAPDMQRTGLNTIAITKPQNILSGDILAIAHDAKGQVNGGQAHHIQVVVKTSADEIWIYQGNSGWSIHKPFTYFFDLIGENPANPSNKAYAGLPIETGYYKKSGTGYNYKNITSGAAHANFLSTSDWFSWNFMGFNN